jgi:WD40 repeat protein
MKLKCMSDKPLLVHLGMVIALLTVSFAPLVARVNFSNAAAAVLLGPQNSKLRVSNPAMVTGWGERSVVKLYGNTIASAWPEAYQVESVIGQPGQPGVTAQAYTNLVDANSNALMNLSQGGSTAVLTRANSNTLLYLYRADSDEIIKLTQGGAEGLLSRTNSGAINLFYSNMAVPTADSIDGTQFAKYCTNNHVFHNNVMPWTARGWVRFNDGFTVMPQASVLMDTLTTVSGGMDLRDTGMLILNNDLYLAHNVTLTNGGSIKGRSSSTGQANTIFMGGDLMLSGTTYVRTLHIMSDWSNSGTTGDLIIDGCGHTLDIQDRAQIFVDTNVTLTLRNMTIKTGPKSLNNPAIQLAAMGSKLALDNVMFDLGTDFYFPHGQIFVHNEVAVTGTSAFVYQSPMPSYITSGATWSFEQGTTFSVAPSTFTDCPFTVNNTYTNNNFIVFADATAALSLNGCSFQTTFTGLRLSKGMVLFDNKVAIDTMAGVDLDSTTPATEIGTGGAAGSSPQSVVWSPDSRYLAVACYSSNMLHVYRFDGSSVPIEIGTGAAASSPSYSVSWSPDGRYLAVVCYSAHKLRIYRFNGSSVPVEIGTGVAAVSQPRSVSWSPDGRYLAVACYGSHMLRVYRFDGSSVPVEIGTGFVAYTRPISVSWSPDGRYLAVACYTSHMLRVYRFDGSSVPVEIGTGVSTGNPSYPKSVVWSPDGRYLAVVGSVDDTLRVYRFDGSSVPVEIGVGVSASSDPESVVWSSDGRFLAVACRNSDILREYRFDGSSMPVEIGTGVSAGFGPQSVKWSPDGRFLAVACNGDFTLHVYSCNYVYSGQPAQGFSNGLLFGDKAKGAAYDANVQVLGGATVSIKGAVYDDAA